MRRWLAILALLLVGSPAAAGSGDVALAREAFQFAFPVYEIARTRAQALGTAEKPGAVKANDFVHRRNLSDHRSRSVTTPNNDTLYSSAFLDLTTGPVRLTLPALPDRYHSAALMDLFTDNFAILGTRTTGGKGGDYLIAGPAWRGKVPRGARLVRAKTADIWLLVRILADGPGDLPAARAAQDALRLNSTQAGSGVAVREAAPADPDPARFLAVVNEMLGRGPLPAPHKAQVKRFARVGIIPGGGQSWPTLPPAIQKIWSDNFARFREELGGGLAGSATLRNGWAYPSPAIGNFGRDYLYRAQVALGGLAALPPREAMYLTARSDAAGKPLDGAASYLLTLPPRPPLDGFWSLSMYEVAPDGRLYFTSNPIGRYAIGDRTRGLTRNRDGSVDILIQRDRPAETANWLPAPPGPFRLVWRAYLPREPLLDGRFSLPPVRRVAPLEVPFRGQQPLGEARP